MKLIIGKNCMPCKILKEWLTDNNINVDQFVAQDNPEMVTTFAIKSVPSLITDDNIVVKGIENIKEILKGSNYICH